MLPSPAFLDALRAALPEGVLSTEPDELRAYGRDWTRVHEPAPSALVRPHTAEEVQRVVRLCSDARVGVVPSGGRTGLAAGAVAARGEVVLSLERMRALGEVDVLGGTVRVEAGAITEAVHHHVEPHGLTWPVDFASKGSSTVGGNLATNAGGVKVIRYGLTRAWVLGLEVVLASGELIRPGGALEKNNTGIDLRQLFIGSEGTLGVITAATLKLTRLPERLDVVLFRVASLAAVLALFRRARSGPFTLSAFEFFTERCLARVLRHRKVTQPFAEHDPEGPAHYVLVEVERPREASGEPFDAWLTSLAEDGVIEDGVMAQSSTEAAQLWSLRESISESLSATGLPHKNDIALPIAALEPFCAAFEARMQERWPGWEVCLFGHIGDGNLHVNVMKPDTLSREAFFERTGEADKQLFELVRAHGGSISAEHGIGLLKKPYLAFSRSPEELALMRGLKAALDPHGILNPGKIL